MEIFMVMAAKKEMKKQPEVPKMEDEAVQEARRKRVAEIQGRRGRGASIVTGGAGLTSEANLGRSSLLGSAS